VPDIISRRASKNEPSITLSFNTRANALKASGEDVVGLAAGEPDFNTPAVIREAAVLAMNQGKTHYTPAAGIKELRETIAGAYSKRLGVAYSFDEVVVSNGAKHSIFNALYALTDVGDDVLIVSPYWTSYPEMIRILGCTCRIIETGENTGYKLTPALLEAELSRGAAKAILLNSPSNPAGIVYRREELEPICRIIRDAGMGLISDEIYEYLTYTGWEHVSPVTLIPELRGTTVVISGVSKSYAMTGWRVGFALAEREVSYRMAAFQAHATGCPNSISQWAALAAIEKGADDREMMRREFEKRKEYVAGRLSRIPGISFPQPGGAFYYLVDASGLFERCGVSESFAFCEKLLEEKGLVLIPGGAFGCDAMVRFSFAAGEDELRKALDRFEAFVRDYSG
jgi:aspartate aminotransferase